MVVLGCVVLDGGVVWLGVGFCARGLSSTWGISIRGTEILIWVRLRTPFRFCISLHSLGAGVLEIEEAVALAEELIMWLRLVCVCVCVCEHELNPG